MKDSSSPEDKLLKLIRNPKKPPAAPVQKTQTSKSKIASGVNNDTALRLNAITAKFGAFFNVRRTFFWLFIASGVYLAWNLIYPLVGLRNIRLPKASEKPIEEKRITKSAAKPLEEYLKSVKRRRIFSGAATAEGVSLINVANVDLMKDISLVGIVSGENPQAVIEDKKAQKTYYVTKGQFIGEMQVEDIQKGKIIINYAGQKYELYM
jgi:hypothetical protein